MTHLEYMDIKIRKNVFETNSSSTHSMVIVPDDGKTYYVYDYDEVIGEEKAKEILLNIIYDFNRENPLNEILVPKEASFKEIKESMKEHPKYDFFMDHWEPPLTIDEWFDRAHDRYLETDTTWHTTPSGDKINIYTAFGNDY